MKPNKRANGRVNFTLTSERLFSLIKARFGQKKGSPDHAILFQRFSILSGQTLKPKNGLKLRKSTAVFIDGRGLRRRTSGIRFSFFDNI